MKQISCLVMALLLSPFLMLLTPIRLYAGGNDLVTGNLRTDFSNVYNAQDYRLFVQAGQLPPAGINARSFTTGWLAVDIASSSPPSGFFQVGMLAQIDGLHWFIEMFDVSNGGVDCMGAEVYWRINGTPAGCRGAAGSIVGLNQWHQVELVKYSQNNYWIARVYDVNGGATDVAKIFISAARIYRAYAAFEEGYTETSDPNIPAQFWLKDPQYYQSGWKSWPFSAVSKAQHNYIEINPSSLCPSKYSTTPFYNLSNPWEWFAGTGGTQCAHLFQPAIYDDNNSAVTYPTGFWYTCGSGFCPRAWKSTLHYSTSVNAKAKLTTISGFHPGTSLSRVYTMGPDRGNSIVNINGAQQWSGSDYSAVKRWQVTRSWAANGVATMEVINNAGCTNCITDIDSFIVDIPRAPAPADNNTAPGYDNYHYLPRFVGSWTHNSTSVPSAGNGTLSWTNTPEDGVSFTFEGTSVKYYYTRHWNRGIAVVTIDGVDYGEVNACGSPTQWHVNDKFPRSGQPALTSGVHTITITAKGTSTCGSGSAYNYIDLDEFRPLQ